MTNNVNAVFGLHPKAAAPSSSAVVGGAAGVARFAQVPPPPVRRRRRHRPSRPTAPVVNNITINVMVPPGTPTAEMGRYVADALDAHERRAGPRRKVTDGVAPDHPAGDRTNRPPSSTPTPPTTTPSVRH